MESNAAMMASASVRPTSQRSRKRRQVASDEVGVSRFHPSFFSVHFFHHFLQTCEGMINYDTPDTCTGTISIQNCETASEKRQTSEDNSSNHQISHKFCCHFKDHGCHRHPHISLCRTERIDDAHERCDRDLEHEDCVPGHIFE